MSDDKIVLATVAFSIPGNLVDELNKFNTQFNVEMIMHDRIHNIFRAEYMNQVYLKVQKVIDPNNQEDLETVDITVNCMDFDSLLQTIATLYHDNPHFVLTGYEPEYKG